MSTKSWAGGAALLPVVVLVVAAWQILPVAPERIPTHWGPSGEADGFGSPVGLLTVMVVIVALGTGLALLGLFVVRDVRTGRLLASVGTGIAALGAAIWTTTLVLTIGAEEPEQVRALLPVTIALAAMLWGFVPWTVLPAPPVPTEDMTVTGADSSDVSVADAVTAVTATVGSPWITVLGWVVVVAGIVVAAIWPLSGTVSGTLGAGVGFATVWMGHARVRVDHEGLRVTSVGTGWPIIRVPIEDIASVLARDVSPGEHGGWGLRVTGRGIALIWGRGPGLVVTKRNGATRTVAFHAAPHASSLLRRYVGTEASTGPARGRAGSG